MPADTKKDIMLRVYLVYAFICLFGLAILVQVFRLQFIQGNYWKEKAESLTTDIKNIEAARGNIYASDGSLLATSMPIYEVRMDMKTDAMTDDLFNKNIDSLAYHLSILFKDKSASQYKRDLKESRRENNRYYLVRRNAAFNEIKQLKQFPLYRLGRYKGGLILVQKNRRERPFRILAERTIGYKTDEVNVGIEGAYNEHLKGVSGKRLMQRISGGVWKPINDDNEIDPRDGNDIITTIDINIQDVAENALMSQLIKHNASKGCVIVMEVATGEIKAIANLSKTASGDYAENYNYAIGSSTEPGSTFKLASMMAALEDGFIELTDSVDTEKGALRFSDRIMRDSKEGGYGKITVQRSFEVSSNVAVSKLIHQYYSNNPQQFIDRLRSFGLDQPVGMQIKGEAIPMIKNTNDKSWSRVSLPWMSIGYETSLTPLQILVFYNTVANNGRRVKPLLVKEVSHHGKTIEKFTSEVSSTPICSPQTIEKLKLMLEGVVENGTATNLKNTYFKTAGKTGTAQIADDNRGYKQGKISYQASFAGYFPADNPLYSCIVIVYSPSNSVYYGNVVAGPIFQEISDKIYSTRLDLHKDLHKMPKLATTGVPEPKAGYKKEIKTVFGTMGYTPKIVNEETDWVGYYKEDTLLTIVSRPVNSGVIPNVTGMGLKDAIYLLENSGLRVRAVGRGSVSRQSLSPGQRVKKGDLIIIELS
jgi:cell division protein FtsI (penicillin-binding protein 3)